MLNKKKLSIESITAGHPVLAEIIKHRPSGVIITITLLSAYTLQSMVNIAIFSCLFSLNKAIVSVNKNGVEQVQQMKEFRAFSIKSSKDRAAIRSLLEKHIKEDK